MQKDLTKALGKHIRATESQQTRPRSCVANHVLGLIKQISVARSPRGFSELTLCHSGGISGGLGLYNTI